METKLKQILSVLLGVDEAEITETTSAETIEGWDSLKQMNIIVALEEEYDVQFDEDESILSDSYLTILEMIKKKTA